MEAATSPSSNLCTDQEQAKKSKHAIRGRVCAHVRTPQGVGAVVVLGGALVGAAVMAWRRRARHCKNSRDGKNHHGQSVKEEFLDGGVVEKEEGGASARKFDHSDENLSSCNTEIATNRLEGKLIEKFDQMDTEISADGLVSETVKKVDKNLVMKNSEISTYELESKAIENFDRSMLSIRSLEISGEEDGNHDVLTASTGITPTRQRMMHQEQIFEEVKMVNMTETREPKFEDGIIIDHEVFEPEEEKVLTELDETDGSLVYSSTISDLVKTVEKKGPANMGCNETGMKLEQDGAKGELKIVTHGVPLARNYRCDSKVFLALMFVLTIGLAVIASSYAVLV